MVQAQVVLHNLTPVHRLSGSCAIKALPLTQQLDKGKKYKPIHKPFFIYPVLCSHTEISIKALQSPMHGWAGRVHQTIYLFAIPPRVLRHGLSCLPSLHNAYPQDQAAVSLQQHYIL